MTASLLARVASAAVLAGVLGAGVAVSGNAQTASPQSGATTQPPAGAAPAKPGTPTAPGSTGTPQTGTTAPRMAPQAPPHPGAAPGTATAPQAPPGKAPATTARAAAPQGMSRMIDQRLADMRAQLQITHAQEPKWRRFAGVMRANARALDLANRRRAERIDSMNAVENMMSYARIERRRGMDIDRLVPAFRALYASLTPAQKRTADELFRARAMQRRRASSR